MKFLFKDSFKIDQVKLTYPSDKDKRDKNGLTLNEYLKEVLKYFKDNPNPNRLKQEKKMMRQIIKDFLPTFPIAFIFFAFGKDGLEKTQL